MLRKILIVVLVLSGLAAVAQDKKDSKNKTEQKTPATPIDYHQVGAPMPRLLLVSLDTVAKAGDKSKSRKHDKKNDEYMLTDYGAKYYTEKHMDNGANLIVMMFNPTCGHCEDETDLLERNMTMFKKTKIILMANPNMKAYLPDFMRNHHINDYPVMTLGTDSLDFIKETFLYQALPQINIYNGKRKLLRIYSGSVSIDTLAQYIQ